MSVDDLGSFLRSRRAALSPERAGVAVYHRRRVPGLRREELAQLAGVRRRAAAARSLTP